MVRRIILFLVLVCGGISPSFAQQASCALYKVNTSVLNVAQEPAGDRYIDALYDGEVTCVVRTADIKGTTWGFIAQKFESATQATAVQGWAALKDLQPISAAEAGALLADAASPAASPNTAPPNVAPQSAQPAAKAVAPAQAVPPTAAPSPPSPPPTQPPAVAQAAKPAVHAAAPMRPEDVLHFDQPIPFGPFPVNGHSIKEMIESTPLFSPVEGLDESAWKKPCTSCHQWNKERLCQQALTYVRQPRFVLRVPHPFGGTLKLALMRWAKSGCD